MSINSVDDIIAAIIDQPARFFMKAQPTGVVAARPVSTWPLAGIPGAGVQSATGLNGSTWSSGSNASPTPVVGQLPFIAAPGGKLSYLTRLVGSMPTGGQLLLCDRLWSNNGMSMTSTSLQAITSPAWPARDNNQSTDGDGALLGLEFTTLGSAGTPTITVGYTNSLGTAGRVATNIPPTVANSQVGTFYPIGLQAGDRGVRSVQSIQLSATWSSGAASLVAYRLIASLDIAFAHAGNAIDPVTGGLPQIFDGSVPFLAWYPSSSTTGPIFGAMTIGQKS
jgi:hypothetical protein